MKEFVAKVVPCKCGGTGMTLNVIRSRYGKDYIYIRCESCLCQSPIKAKVVMAINAWNSHFGEKEKKRPASFGIDENWEQFL